VRVIFDRSAFHGENFTKLVSSPLRRLIERGCVTVLHTPIFLEETIQSHERGSEEWKAHLHFALDVCNGGIFLTKEEIWRNELVRGQGPHARYLFPGRGSRHIRSLPAFIQDLRNLTNSEELRSLWNGSQAEREETQQRKNNQRDLFSEIREEVSAARREERLCANLKQYTFDEFRNSELARTASMFMSLVDARRSSALASQWTQNPNRFPFYTAFMEGVLYSAYYAMIEHNLALDRNAQADFEQLTYLLWADVVVSNDERFFKSTFQAIWKSRKKYMKSTDEFVTFLEAINFW
jgi:hypothetical protein